MTKSYACTMDADQLDRLIHAMREVVRNDDAEEDDNIVLLGNLIRMRDAG